MRAREEQGFTLLELIISILIVGILLAIAAPAFLGQQNQAYDSKAKQQLAVAYKEAKAIAASQSGSFTTGSYTTSSLASAISAAEPEFGGVGLMGCPDGMPSGKVNVVSGVTAGQNLELAEGSQSGTPYTLQVTGNGRPQISAFTDNWMSTLKATSSLVSAWPLAEGPGQTTATDITAANNGTYIGSQGPNLISNPSFETNTTGWTASGAGVTFTRTNAWAADGSWSVESNATPTSNDMSDYSPAFAVSAGSTVAARATLNILHAATGGAPEIVVQWDNGSNSFSLGSYVGTPTPWQTGVVNLTALTTAAPAGTTQARLRIVGSTSGTQQIDWYLDAVSAITDASSVQPYSSTQGLTLGSSGPGVGCSEAASFDGQSGLVQIPAAQSTALGAPLTIEAWVQPSAATGGYEIFAQGNGTGNYSFLDDHGHLRLYLNGSSVSATDTGAAIATGTWNFVAVTYDGTNAKFYLNGALNSTVSAPATITSSTNPAYIAMRGDNSNYWLGSIADVALFNQVLSAATLSAHYHAGCGC